MGDLNTDVLMRIVAKTGAMPAESRTEFMADKVIDTLRTGFDIGKFCDLSAFKFAAGVETGLSKKEKKRAKAASDDQSRPRIERGLEIRQSQANKSVKRGQAEAMDMQPVEFTRVLDTASTLLFQAMTNCETLDEVSIAKRKAAGTSNAGEIFLRLDFQSVLVTELEWEDKEHVVEETGTFIYRSLTMRYRPQRANGTLGTIIPMTWKMKQIE